MTIRRSLLIGLALLALLGALQGGAAVLSNASLGREVAAQAARLATVNQTSAAQLAFERANHAAQEVRRAPDPASARALTDRFRAEATRVEQALAEAARLDPSLAPLRGGMADWFRQTELRLPASTGGGQTSLLREDLLTDRSLLRQMEIGAGVDTVLRTSTLASEAAARRAAQAQTAISAVVVLSVAGGALLAWLLHRRVLRPLAALTRATRHLAAGELERRVADTGRDDEIGDVARALEALRHGTLHARTVEAAAAAERAAADSHIRRLALHDPLTGLANRALLQQRLDAALLHVHAGGAGFALLCIDLDGFKAVNDSHGHAAGDALLCEVARRLRTTLRTDDMVARVGGDEFIVVTESEDGRPDAVERLAGRLVETLAEPCDVTDGHQAVVSASIGIARCPADGDDADTLLARADTAMYRVKQDGRSGFACFRAEMDEAAQTHRMLDQELRLALRRNELSLAFQPQVNLARDEVVGFEVLLRWRHPERGQVPPDLFVPIAEASGSIVPIGAWVLRQACDEAARWPTPLRIAVNVSPVQFQRCDVAALVADALATSGLPPARLELEVTEGMLIRDPLKTLEALRRIRASGVSVAMDDFGTGHSSFSTLRAFPFDRIKIDRSFVRDLATSREAAAIVHGVLGVGRGFNLPVVAEGVETPEQLSLLRSAGCAEGQGYLFGKPSPIHRFSDLTQAAGPPRVCASLALAPSA